MSTVAPDQEALYRSAYRGRQHPRARTMDRATILAGGLHENQTFRTLLATGWRPAHRPLSPDHRRRGGSPAVPAADPPKQ